MLCTFCLQLQLMKHTRHPNQGQQDCSNSFLLSFLVRSWLQHKWNISSYFKNVGKVHAIFGKTNNRRHGIRDFRDWWTLRDNTIDRKLSPRLEIKSQIWGVAECAREPRPSRDLQILKILRAIFVERVVVAVTHLHNFITLLITERIPQHLFVRVLA